MKRSVGLWCAAVVVLVGCEPKETDTGLCREVYTALCERSFECEQIEEINACITYYREDCRSRQLQLGAPEPSDAELAGCVEAIEVLDCNGSLSPVGLAECPFLIEPVTDGGAGDGGLDGGLDGGDAAAAADAGADAPAGDAG